MFRALRSAIRKKLNDEKEGTGEENEGSYRTGEERAEATNGDVSVGREEGLEVRFVAEFGEGGRRRRHGG